MGIKKPTETALVRAVLDYLRLLGWLVWRNNSGARVLPGHGGRGQLVRWGRVGSGDVLAVAPGGRFVSLECKQFGRKPTAAQEAWMADVNASGGFGCVVYSLAQLEATLRQEGLLP